MARRTGTLCTVNTPQHTLRTLLGGRGTGRRLGYSALLRDQLRITPMAGALLHGPDIRSAHPGEGSPLGARTLDKARARGDS